MQGLALVMAKAGPAGRLGSINGSLVLACAPVTGNGRTAAICESVRRKSRTRHCKQTQGSSDERRHTPGHDATSVDAHDAVHRLARDLDLDSEQQRLITEIPGRHQKDVDTAWQPHMCAAGKIE
jgi:hypothetical protein